MKGPVYRGSKWHIYNVYMGSGRAIYNDIAPRPRFFALRGKKIPEGRAVPEGRRPEGTALPEGIFLTRRAKNRGRGGYIVVYSPTRPHIYNKCAIFFSLFYKGFINKLLILCSTHQIPQLMMLSLTVSSRGFRHASELGLYLYYFSNITDKRSGNLL